MAFEEGPYVQVACFCEEVIEDKTGRFSLIHIIDTLIRSSKEPTSPEQMQPFSKNLKLVVMLKAGMAQGRSTLRIVQELPTGETEEPIEVTAYFDGDERGWHDIRARDFLFRYEGLYWFKVYLDDQKLAAIPLRVRYIPVR